MAFDSVVGPRQDEAEVAGSDSQAWEKKFETRNKKAQDLHRVLATILSGLKELCETGMVFDYKHRDTLHRNLFLKCFILFIKADTDEADKLCAHYSLRSAGSRAFAGVARAQQRI